MLLMSLLKKFSKKNFMIYLLVLILPIKKNLVKNLEKKIIKLDITDPDITDPDITDPDITDPSLNIE